jgi:hypothetical protein
MTHPKLTPPPELVGQWYDWATAVGPDYLQEIADRSAQWGADQELEACCEWVKSKQTYWAHDELRAARRPKPPSLKEQALEQLDCVEDILRNQGVINTDIVRRAIEALPDD